MRAERRGVMEPVLRRPENQTGALQRAHSSRRLGPVRPLVDLIRRKQADRQRNEKTAQRSRDHERTGQDGDDAERHVAVQVEEWARHDVVRTVTPAIRAAGAARLLEFLGDAFGAVEASRDLGPSGEIRHAEVRVGDSMLEVSDAHGQWGPAGGAFHLFVSDCDEVYEQALRAGATTVMPPADMPYGERSATVADGFGNLWFIARPLTAS